LRDRAYRERKKARDETRDETPPRDETSFDPKQARTLRGGLLPKSKIELCDSVTDKRQGREVGGPTAR
jgi:hypothetical protein